MGSSWSWGPGPRSILWTVGWGAPGLGRSPCTPMGSEEMPRPPWGRPGLKDAVDDMSVANLDPDHDGLITGKPHSWTRQPKPRGELK